MRLHMEGRGAHAIETPSLLVFWWLSLSVSYCDCKNKCQTLCHIGYFDHEHLVYEKITLEVSDHGSEYVSTKIKETRLY